MCSSVILNFLSYSAILILIYIVIIYLYKLPNITVIIFKNKEICLQMIPKYFYKFMDINSTD